MGGIEGLGNLPVSLARQWRHYPPRVIIRFPCTFEGGQANRFYGILRRASQTCKQLPIALP